LIPDISTVGELVKSIGFPAAVTLVLLYQVFFMHRENNRTSIKYLRELARLRAAVQKLADAISRKEK
jgi:hypothetical protein